MQGRFECWLQYWLAWLAWLQGRLQYWLQDWLSTACKADCKLGTIEALPGSLSCGKVAAVWQSLAGEPQFIKRRGSQARTLRTLVAGLDNVSYQHA